MVLNYKKMILTTVISSKFLKVCFIYGLSMTGVMVIELLKNNCLLKIEGYYYDT